MEENEKFSYLLIYKGELPRQKYNDPQETTSLAEKSYFWPRIVRPNIKRQKHVVMDLCTRESETLQRVTKTKGKLPNHIYKYVRKAGWGDLWPFS